MSISVSNVTKTYGEQKALDQVSFEIGPGQIVGFLGPNGAGKSTMMKIITCFIPQDSGKVKVCGYDVEEQSMEVRKNVGYLPEHNPLYLDMYVKEYLGFIAGLHKLSQKKKRVQEMIDTVGLQVEQHKKIGALSKGYRQRVGLAQALIHDPKVLILDEPTSGLDPNQIVEIRSLIQTVGREKTVMMSTHIMQEVEAICDSVIIVNRGKIVADDSASKVRESEVDRTAILVEFEKEVAEQDLLGIPGVEGVSRSSERTWLLLAASDEDIRKKVSQFAVDNDNLVLTMQKQEKKLEDVFKDLTSKD